jgi:hypothetical protein
MTSNKKVHVITMDNLRDNELFELIKGLNEISGFDFSIDTFVMIKNDQIPHTDNLPK